MNFESTWKSTYSSWLDLIQKRKPQKTLSDAHVSAVIDLRPLWDVNSITTYSNLNTQVKQTLSELSQLSYNWLRYNQLVRFTFEYFSFDKEKYGAVYELIGILKINDRWTNLKKYQIKKINDVNIESLWALTAAEITALVANKKGYDDLSSSIQITLRNLLDLDVDSSSKFNQKDGFYDIFRKDLWHRTSVNQILNALRTRIDNIIKQVKDDGKKLWTFLQTGNRLSNIKTRLIPYIANVDISSLHRVRDTTSYERLGNNVKKTLYELLQIIDYKIQINTDIRKDATTKNIWDNFLKQNDRLTNLKLYKINIIDDFLSTFQNINTGTAYSSFNNVQRKMLNSFTSNKKKEVEDEIDRNKIIASSFAFYQKNNHLANIQKLQLKTIDNITLLPILANVKSSTLYTDLSSEQKTLIYSMTQRGGYRNTLSTAIQTAHTAASNAWTFLTNDDRLTKIKQYQIKTIDDVTLLPALTKAAPSTRYTVLSSEQQAALYALSKRTGYQSKVNTAIQAAHTAASNAWTFLINSNRLANIKQYQLQTIDTIKLLLVLTSAEISTPYIRLTPSQQTVLYDLSQREDYQKKVTDAINIAQNVQATSNAWTFLKTSNRLANIKKYKIKIIDTIKLLPALVSAEASTRYSTDLSSSQQIALYDLSQREDYQKKVNAAIQIAQAGPPNAWTFLITSNRLANIKKFQLKTIDTITLLPILISAEPSKSYTGLTPSQKTVLFDLSQRENYQQKVTDAIAFAQNASDAWTFLTTYNRLTQIQTYYIIKIKNVTLITGHSSTPDFLKVKISTRYTDLSSAQQKILYDLSQIKDYQTKVDNAIQSTQTIAVNAWTFLKAENRLAYIKKFKIRSVAGSLPLWPDLASAETSTPYIRLTLSQQSNLRSLGGRSGYQTKVDDAIQSNKNTAASAAWTFLKAENRLAYIKKFKLQTIDTIKILPAFINVETSTLYTDLTPSQQTVLFNLSQRTDYKQKINIAIQTAQTAASRVWTHFKITNFLTKIQQYQLQTIDTIKILPAFINAETSTSYTGLTIPQKTVLYDLSQRPDYQNEIRNAITAAQTAASDTWTFLKTENRLANLKQYQIKTIDTVELLPLFRDVVSNTQYENLTSPQKTNLYLLSKIKDYQTKVTDAITFAQNASNAWNFLKTSNHLTNIQKYQIKTIDTIELLPALVSAETSTLYTGLSSEEQAALYTLSKRTNYQSKVNVAITAVQTAASNAWTFLTTNDRLANLKQYQIKTIDKLELLPFFQEVVLATEYKDLTDAQKLKFYNLSKIKDYQTKIDNVIAFAQNASSAWVFLTTNDRLKNLKQYSLNPIKEVPLLLTLFQDVAATVEYIALSGAQKTLLYNLSQVASYQSTIDDQIAKAAKNPKTTPVSVQPTTPKNPDDKNKATPKLPVATPKPQIISLSDVWKFLQANNRLKKLQTNKTLKTKNFDLSIFTKTKPTTKYETLTLEQNTALNTLSQLDNYQDEIKNVIIQTAQAITSAWTFLQTNNRLQKLQTNKTLKTSKFDLSVLATIKPNTQYEDLSPKQNEVLRILSKLNNYQNEIKNVIQTTQDTVSAWTFLQTNNHLQKLQTNKTLKTSKFDLSVLATIKPNIKYEDLSLKQKKALQALSKLANYQDEIKNVIKTTQATASAWTFLQTNNHLQKLQTNKTLKTSNFDLTVLTTVKPNTKYEDLSLEQKKALQTLSKLDNYQNKIKNILNKPTTTKTENGDNLLWLWITLPLFLVSLIFGLGFYLYRFKKLSIFKFIKPKK